MKEPCSNCPFRKDSLKGSLNKERAVDIVNAETFTCHKTDMKKQCAGHMLLMDIDNIFVRLAKRMCIPLKLSGKDLVFDTSDDFIKHQGK
jgi:hypothetical protein